MNCFRCQAFEYIYEAFTAFLILSVAPGSTLVLPVSVEDGLLIRFASMRKDAFNMLYAQKPDETQGNVY